MSEEDINANLRFRHNVTRLVINAYIQNDEAYWETLINYIKSEKKFIWGEE